MGKDVFKDNMSITVHYQKLVDAIASLESHQADVSAEFKEKYDDVLGRAKAIDGNESASLEEVNTMCDEIDQLIQDLGQGQTNTDVAA